MAFPTTTNPSFTWGAEGSNFPNVRNMKEASVLGPAIVFAKITPDATGLIPLTNPLTGQASPTRSIIADVAGTVTGHDAFGNAVATFPLQAGWNDISLAGVTSIATTTQVWGVW